MLLLLLLLLLQWSEACRVPGLGHVGIVVWHALVRLTLLVGGVRALGPLLAREAPLWRRTLERALLGREVLWVVSMLEAWALGRWAVLIARAIPPKASLRPTWTHLWTVRA